MFHSQDNETWILEPERSLQINIKYSFLLEKKTKKHPLELIWLGQCQTLAGQDQILGFVMHSDGVFVKTRDGFLMEKT